MPLFSYVAKKGPEQIIQGTMEAESQDRVLSELSSMGYVPVQIKEENPEKKESFPLADKKIRSRDLAIFIRQLASLVRANVAILKAIDVLNQQTANQDLRRMLEEIKDKIKEGNMLSDAMTRFPRTFPSLFTNMIRSGELSGSLDAVLVRLADFAEKEEEFQAKVRSALAYPIFLVCAGVITVFVLITFVIPKLMALFTELNATLPLITRILIKISYFSSHYWYWMIGGITLMVFTARQKQFLAKEKAFFDRLFLKIPLLGKLIRETEIARFARTISLLYENGIPIYQAVEMGIPTVDNTLLQGNLLNIPANLKGGATLADSMRSLKTFPPFVVNMISIGEETGKLGDSLSEIAVYYERESDTLIKIMTTLIEPFMILIVGAVVGFIVIAMLLPVFEINVFVQ